ncbi:aminoethylphosphonate catabolism associated LysR family transcriptional regulator [Aliiroseovarius crassostreae]|uniref:LysR family transcriptional regulator n=1 Tax=Aliiroseovarius crassostreae TaxID=154981 RepID=A0A0P7IJ26_9RHOB|nr:LysR substrate-binding domain-containing protein [Aliiroseovarius crassostreae]KPN63872.1 LysR family transcriptional regulator [Aliiroseovarius crassostreae]SFU82962.1 aminoethylphosphonate catabolism associated LysR family transcriptional regulator [Aliiroseovarius crassostreae]
MRHRQLKAFHHVARFGGFSRAAEALFLTQPAISEQVRKLEQDHDTLLFHRERKRVRLTETGEQLFLLTKRYFEVESQIEEYLSQKGAAMEGELRILADSAHHVTELLGQFKKRYPKTTISLRVGNTEKVIEELRAYNAEIGVIGSISPGQDITVHDLGASEIVAFAAHELLLPSQEAASLEDLAKYPLVFRESGSKTRQKLEEEALRQGITLTPAIVAEGREAVREVVASGAGVGFVSLAEYVHDARFRKISLSGAQISMSESLVHLTQRSDVKVIRAFMEIARKSHP